MRMLTMNTLIHDTEHLRQDDTSHVVHSPMASSDEEDGDVDELDPVDGFPSPPVRVRPRRRFVKLGQTTYELSFSRRHANARRAGAGRIDTPAAVKVQTDGQDEHRPAPAVSSLSSVLTEVMTGKTKALNNIVDTTPPQPNVTYVVEHAADGTPYVVASDGNKYFANSAIGQIFLKPVLNHDTSQEEDSNLDFLQSGGWHQQSTRQSDSIGVETMTTVSSLSTTEATNAEQVVENDVDVKKGPKALLGFKGFPLRKKKEKGSATDLKALQEQDDSTHTAVVDLTDAIAHQEMDNELPILDPEYALQRNRANSCWEAPPAKSNARQEPELPQPTAIRLLDSNGMQTANQARSDLLAGLGAATNDSDVRDSSSSLSARSSTSSTGPVGAPIKTLPRLQPKKDIPAPPTALDAYDEDDNPLCRSFQNVRNVDLIRPMSDELEDDEEHEHGHDEEHECAAAAADDDIPDVNSPDFAGRVRVSSGATSVAEFVGGFKGQLSRRSGASGLVNRKRAVRHARLTAEEQMAADLARKIREARNRIPLEFRDEYMSPSAKNELQKKKNRLARGRRVHYNPDVLIREFEVDSENDDDGYDSPDEIVDAVQLVSKRDVVRAEDVVAAFPMQQLELPSEDTSETIVQAPSPSALGANAEVDYSVQNDPLTFSQLNNDKRMSFSDL